MGRLLKAGILVALAAGCQRSGFDGAPDDARHGDDDVSDGGDTGGDSDTDGGDTLGGDSMEPGDPATEVHADLLITAPPDFGTRPVDNPGVEQTVSVMNQGDGDATLGTASSDSDDFAPTGGTCAADSVLAAGASCTLTISFAPKSLGPLTGTLTLPYDDAGAQKSATAPLSGSGRAPTSCEELDPVTTTDYNAAGAGDRDDPYILCYPLQLLDVMSRSLIWKRHFALGKDIDLDGLDQDSTPKAVRPIGTTAVPFTGSFDGRGFAIQHLRYHDILAYNAGLFGTAVGSATEIKNLQLTDVDILAYEGAGALLGTGFRVTVSNCSALRGTVETTTTNDIDSDVGGLIGLLREGALVSASWAELTVNAADAGCGGLIGWLDSGMVRASYARSTVTCVGDAGGLVGGTMDNALVVDSYAIGDITATSGRAAGLVAFNGFDKSYILRSFAAATVTGGVGTETGLLVGDPLFLEVSDMNGPENPSHIPNCYSYGDAICTAPAGCHVPASGEAQTFDLTELYSGALPGLSDWVPSGEWHFSADDFPTLEPEVLDLGSFDCDTHMNTIPFAAGVGTASSPYLICSADQLLRVARSPSKWTGRVFRMMRDIDLFGIDASDLPIGQVIGFRGVFDGGGHKIMKLSLDGNGANGIAVFSGVSGIVRRLGVEDATLVDGGLDLAILASAANGVIIDTYATGTVTSTNAFGLIGQPFGHFKLLDSYTDVVIDADNGGGLTNSLFATVENCFAAGTVTVATDGGPLIYTGSIGAGNYFADDSCTGCTNALGTPFLLSDDPAYFQSRNNAPLSAWDFDNVWQEVPGQLPQLLP